MIDLSQLCGTSPGAVRMRDAGKALWLALVILATAPLLASGKEVAAQRPLPVPRDKPLAEGPKHFVHPDKGDDANPGTEAGPWRTLQHALGQLDAGDVLYLRGGLYYERVTCELKGKPGAPITIGSYPGELAILDGGYPEFYESPETAWEPAPGGAKGEYRSVSGYPDLGQEVAPRRQVYVMGNFADSMVPLHGYHELIDLRTGNKYWSRLDNNMTRAQGIYCGPGVWYDAFAIGDDTYGTKRIHIRLAHTDFGALGGKNYRGEKDPRKLRLVIGGPDVVLDVRGAEHVRFEDLVLRGTRNATMRIDKSKDITLDHLTLYGGVPALTLTSNDNVRITHTEFRGLSAPWSFRTSEKYRGASAYLFYAEDEEPRNDNVEISYCEFTDCHDGPYVYGIQNLDFHHNYVDNFNDDGIEVGPKRRSGRLLIHHNLLSRALQMFTLHGARVPGEIVPHEPGSGTYIYRNVIDLRQPINRRHPKSPEDTEVYAPSRLASDHGSPIWPVIHAYHNTILAPGRAYRGSYARGLGGHLRGTRRVVLNNVFLQVTDEPGLFLESGENDLFVDGNLHWSVQRPPGHESDPLAETRRKGKWFDVSKQKYPPGWTAHDVFAAPRFQRFGDSGRSGEDLRLQESSPAVDAGVALPGGYPDSDREQDAGKPDVGAFPLGSEVLRVGVDGRVNATAAEPGK